VLPIPISRARTRLLGLHILGSIRRRCCDVTASLGVAASSDGPQDAPITDADAALYTAERDGKNRTVQSVPRKPRTCSEASRL